MSLMSLTAVELGKKIKAKEVTVTEAVTAALDAIEAKEKKVLLLVYVKNIRLYVKNKRFDNQNIEKMVKFCKNIIY